MSVGLVPSMYLYLAEGTVITLTNTVLLSCIMGKRKNRERREFLLIAVQAFADTFYALAFMLMAQYRLELVAEGEINGNSTVWECAKLVALPLHNWATPLLGLLPLTTSMNFLACSLFPLWYLRQRIHYTISILLAPHLVSLLLFLANYILIWGDESPIPALCVAAKGATHPTIYSIMLALRMIANLASALIYAAILIYLKRAQSVGLQELTAHQRKNHRNATITLGCVTLNSMILLLIPDVLLFFNPQNISKDYSTLLYSMTLSKTTINFFIYMWRYKELADMVVSMTCRRLPQLKKYFPERISKTSVAPIVSGDFTSRRISRAKNNIFFEQTKAEMDRKLKVIEEETEEQVEEEVEDKKDDGKEDERNERRPSQELLKDQRITQPWPEITLDVSRFWYNI